jgi:hypothetical protein
MNSGHGMEGSQMDGKRDNTPRDVPMVLEARLSIKVPAAGRIPAGRIPAGRIPSGKIQAARARRL